MTREVMAPADRIGLSRGLAASLIGVSPGTFDAMIVRGEMPRPKLIGARRVWSRAEVEAAFDRLPSGEIVTAIPAAAESDRGASVVHTADRRPPWERRPS